MLVIVRYDPAWPATFEAEALRIRGAMGDLARRIDHVGSTSVPDLAAKPVIDIQVSVPRLDPMDLYREPLHGIGYTHVPHSDDAVYPFFHRPAGWPHLYHIHVCEAGGTEERRHLALRDYLRDHPQAAREYAQLKRRLVPQFSAETFESRNAYSEAKSGFIAPLLANAIVEGYPRDLESSDAARP
jgi:GrpB-like predicted nucleotidyltransferase (UPF0157 family)